MPTIVGAITLLYGCVCAFGQDDLKKVLAYSTVSQIGYMFLAVGLGNGVYAIGILHRSSEREILKLRYGLETGRVSTLDEVGGKFRLTRERIRQIEAKAMKKLQHSTRARSLQQFV